jgi:phosphatidylinositol 3-kinase
MTGYTFRWNEWLVLPIKYRDLPASAQLVITIWDTEKPRKTVPVGGTTFRLFGEYL